MKEEKKKILESIFLAGLEAVDPERAVRRHVRLRGGDLRVGDRTYPLDRFKRIFLVGAGKGSAPMAKAIEDILEDRVTEGWVVVKYGHGVPLKRTRTMEAGHPIPDEAGLVAAEKLLQHLESCTEDDLVLCAFSGGGSALLPAPRHPLKLFQKQETTRLLLECGAGIDEINAIRKHLSRSKGGALARAAYPATVVSLFLSDVIGDRLDVIASGPTVPDTSTFSECMQIMERYGLKGRIPGAVLEFLKKGEDSLIEETPKEGDPVFDRVQNLVVGSNREALLAAAKRAASLGYNTLVLTSRMQGEAREVAQVFAAIGKEICESGHPVAAPACVLSGGETTVSIRGSGKGGRNQEMALAAAIALDGWSRIAFLSAGTDGTDGPTDAAGAFADGDTFHRALLLKKSPREFLERNDSYSFFEQLGGLLKTGPTRTNVMDFVCVIVD